MKHLKHIQISALGLMLLFFGTCCSSDDADLNSAENTSNLLECSRSNSSTDGLSYKEILSQNWVIRNCPGRNTSMLESAFICKITPDDKYLLHKAVYKSRSSTSAEIILGYEPEPYDVYDVIWQDPDGFSLSKDGIIYYKVTFRRLLDGAYILAFLTELESGFLTEVKLPANGSCI